MSWYTEMIPMLRSLIDDLCDGDEEYSDSRLKEILSISARYVVQEIDFTTTYTVGIVPPNISPDPMSSSDGDVFTNFIVLKSACMVERGPFRKRMLIAGIEAKCGPTTMKTLDQVKGFTALLKLGYCGVYETTKEEYLLGNVNFCKAILSPFVNDSFCPEDLMLSRTRNFNHNEYRL